jgi:Bacterial Ig domain
MLLRWDSQNPGQTVAIQTPFPTWDGVIYTNSNTTDVPTFKTGKATDFLTKVAAPIANDDSTTGAVNTPVRIDVMSNDVCVGRCDPASFSLKVAPNKGTVASNGDGTVTYTPGAGFTGSDSFKYTVRDTTTGTTESNSATVTIAVSAPPVANKDSGAGITETVFGIDLTANDTNCSPSTCSVTIVNPPSHGTVTPNVPNVGQVTYLSAPGYIGSDLFSYTATNKAGTSKSANVAVDVKSVAVRDTVTITQTKYSSPTLQMNGTVSAINNAFAPSVTIYTADINASWTACMGTAIATVPVDNKGRWSFSANVAIPVDVCVQSKNFGTAYTVVQ